jgi:hypothetical protein
MWNVTIVLFGSVMVVVILLVEGGGYFLGER